MSISWKQVLEIESFLNKHFEDNASSLEKFLWRNPNSMNYSVFVSRSKNYTFDELYEYLLKKYPSDKMLLNGKKQINELYIASESGHKLCEINEELLDLNINQNKYVLNEDKIKRIILNTCSEHTGSLSFFFFCLKYVLNKDPYLSVCTSFSSEIRNKIKNSFLEFIFQFLDQDIITKLKESSKIDTSVSNVNCPKFIVQNYDQLKLNHDKFLKGSWYKVDIECFEENNYQVPYTINDYKRLFFDSQYFSISEVIKIVFEENSNYFNFKIRENSSPYPQDQKFTSYGDLIIYTTLTGLLNYDKILFLGANNNLIQYVKEILSKEFQILSSESIIDNHDPEIYDLEEESSVIVGKDLNMKMLYNQFDDKYHNKVISGFVWKSDDFHGNKFSNLSYSEDQKEINTEINHTFEYRIENQLICYLEKSYWETENLDDLLNEGYWLSKEDFLDS